MPGVPRTLILPAHDLWYTFSPQSLLVFEIRVERLFGAWMWDPVLLTFLKLPAWLIFGAPGVALLLRFRPRRDQGAAEDVAAVVASFELYEELSQRAIEENQPGEEHGPQDILPEEPIDDDEIISTEESGKER